MKIEKLFFGYSQLEYTTLSPFFFGSLPENPFSYLIYQLYTPCLTCNHEPSTNALANNTNFLEPRSNMSVFPYVHFNSPNLAQLARCFKEHDRHVILFYNPSPRADLFCQVATLWNGKLYQFKYTVLKGPTTGFRFISWVKVCPVCPIDYPNVLVAPCSSKYNGPDIFNLRIALSYKRFTR